MTKKQVLKRPFPIREYDALGVLAEADATAAKIQAATHLPAGGRHASRALERLRAFGHVSRHASERNGPGRPEYVYSLTCKGAKRLEWLDSHKYVSPLATTG